MLYCHILAYIKQKGLSVGMLQGCPTTPTLLQTRLSINWASEAAFGLIPYVSGPRLRRGDRQCNKSVCQLTATSDGFPPATAVISTSCSQPAERTPNQGSKSVTSMQTNTHIHAQTESPSAAEMRLSKLTGS